MEQDILSIASGSLVGFVLGLVGGGGSIIAVPLLLYVVGVASPHVAIGTSAIAALAIEGAQAVVPEGSDRSSRVARVLSFPCPAGAADRTGQYETLCTLSPPFRFG